MPTLSVWLCAAQMVVGLILGLAQTPTNTCGHICKYVNQKGLAAILTSIQSEVNLRITQVREHARDPPWLWNPGKTSPDVQNKCISGSMKRIYKCPQKRRKTLSVSTMEGTRVSQWVKTKFLGPHHLWVQNVLTSLITTCRVDMAPPPTSRTTTLYTFTKWQIPLISVHHLLKILEQKAETNSKVGFWSPTTCQWN